MTVAPAVGRAYGGQSADQRDAGRRERLLDAAHELIGTAGYAATTVEQICRAANVSTRHFYQRYDGKEDVFLDVYRSITEQSFAGAFALYNARAAEPIQLRLPAAVVAYLEPMLTDIRSARIAFVEIVGVSPRAEHLRLDMRERLVELISSEGSAAVQRGEIADRDFRFATLALAGAATAVVYDWASRPVRPLIAEMEQSLMTLAVDLITR
jgi:AcrR family transcriptional regulator